MTKIIPPPPPPAQKKKNGMEIELARESVQLVPSAGEHVCNWCQAREIMYATGAKGSHSISCS